MVRYKYVRGTRKLCRVGTDGSVWTQNRWGKPSGEWMRLKQSPERKGGVYRVVSVKYKGKFKKVRVHALVLEAFIGPCPPGMECRHRNGIAFDNRLSNLRWASHKRNIEDRTKHGTTARGERHGRSKLSDEEDWYIKEVYTPENKKELARFFKVSVTMVRNRATK